MAQDWSKQEVAHIVEDYFFMLQQELQGRTFSKKVHREILSSKLQDRSSGSIEFKHQNISAVLANLGKPYINGYKPRGNYQQLLEEEVARFIDDYIDTLEPLFELFANAGEPNAPIADLDFAQCLEPAPSPSKKAAVKVRFRAARINYLEREQHNRVLGASGERFVIDYEKWRLAQEGRSDLIPYIEWTSQKRGDGTGYDILSKNANGSDRFIEAKTTKLSKETPIYLTSNEVIFADRYAKNFYLYRVFDFTSSAKLFIHQGSYDHFCRLEPIAYRGIF